MPVSDKALKAHFSFLELVKLIPVLNYSHKKYILEKISLQIKRVKNNINQFDRRLSVLTNVLVNSS